MVAGLGLTVLPGPGGEGPAQGLDPVPDLRHGQVLDLLRGDGGVQVVEGQVSPVLAQGEADLVGLVMFPAAGGEAVGVFLAGGTVLGLGEQVLALGLVLAADGDGEGAVLGQQGGDRVAGQDGLQGGGTVQEAQVQLLGQGLRFGGGAVRQQDLPAGQPLAGRPGQGAAHISGADKTKCRHCASTSFFKSESDVQLRFFPQHHPVGPRAAPPRITSP